MPCQIHVQRNNPSNKVVSKMLITVAVCVYITKKHMKTDRTISRTTRGCSNINYQKKKKKKWSTQRKNRRRKQFEYKAPYANCQRDSRTKETGKRADAWKLVKLPEPGQFPGRRKICANSTIGSSCLLACKSVPDLLQRQKYVARCTYVRTRTKGETQARAVSM